MKKDDGCRCGLSGWNDNWWCHIFRKLFLNVVGDEKINQNRQSIIEITAHL